jgi:hypothetical protein
MEGALDDSDFAAAARHTQSVVLGRVAHDGVEVTTDAVQGSGAAVLVEASERADLVVVDPVAMAGSPVCCWARFRRR